MQKKTFLLLIPISFIVLVGIEYLIIGAFYRVKKNFSPLTPRPATSQEGLSKYQDLSVNKTIIKGRVKSIDSQNRLIGLTTDEKFFYVYIDPKASFLLSSSQGKGVTTKSLKGDQLEKLAISDIIYLVCENENCLSSKQVIITKGRK